ncbi:helix-turn-helix domain-containing protein [Nereida sp. MMG025]|uniref:MerR family transcriptional regulator n=1 Tax=Nereida sp. MMG025 TaxID=2909981 RepID=UPI001F2E593F|nr:helix-turn-helix domain-containing protein [Nereida sp. MMG025]MCF6445195.1 helix-turn-helix domain-containing protein [Nereida sp. MMG025]
MYSIGQLSKATGVKVPTIRYYEQVGVLASAGRTDGNQRRYDQDGVERLGFIKHARDLGFSIEAITALIDLQQHPDRSCADASAIAKHQLADVQEKLRRLSALEAELIRISDGCDGDGVSGQCYVLASLADHKHCRTDH